ncbi:MAG: O-antigen ligase family protein [Anaerolineales bacterium]|nr:O-antigen ligase family protein [Anaerolineales bacterium]
MNSTTALPLRAETGPATGPAARAALLNWSLELILGVVLAYLLVIGLSPNVLWPTAFSAITLGLMAILIGVWAWDRTRTQPARLGWFPGAAGVWLGAGVVVANASLEPARSWNAWGQTLALLAVFVLLADLTAGSRHGRALNVLLWAGALAMLWTWWQAGTWYASWLGLNPQQWLPTVPYRLPNPNQIALQLALLLVPAALQFWRSPGARRWWLAVFIVSAGALLFLTSSRGGWMGAAAGLVALALALVDRTGAQRRSLQLREHLRARPWLIAVAVTLVGLALALVGFVLWKQLDQPTRGGRLEYWLPAWQTFLAHPVLGQGQATFAISFLQTHTAPPGVLYNHAHSLYFNTLAETGLVGLIVGGGLLLAFANELWRRRSVGTPESRAAFALGCGAVAVFLVHGTVDNVAFDKGNVLILLVLLAGVFEVDSTRRASFATGRVLLTAVVATVTVGLGAYSLWRDEPLHAGTAVAATGEWAGAVAQFQIAVAREPGSPAAWQQLALAQARLAEAGDAPALTDAIAALNRANTLDPYWPANALNLGALYRSAGDLASARLWLERAVAAAPRVALYHVNLGRVLEESGDDAAAGVAYEQALTLAPEQAAAPFWDETPLRRSVRAAWQSAHPPEPDPYAALDPNSGLSDAALAAAERALAAGDPAEAEYWLALADLGYWAQSSARLRWAWRLAEVRAVRGDPVGAITLASRLQELTREPSSFGPGTGGGSVYGTYVAVRPTLQAELVPQVLDLAPTVDWPARFAIATGWCAQVEATERAGLPLCASGERP